eukprot:jgi/Ulvmu1/2815/UM142_0013.1
MSAAHDSVGVAVPRDIVDAIKSLSGSSELDGVAQAFQIFLDRIIANFITEDDCARLTALFEDWKASAEPPTQDSVDIQFSHASIKALAAVLKAATGSDDDQRQLASFVVHLCAGRVPSGSWAVDKAAALPSTAPEFEHYANAHPVDPSSSKVITTKQGANAHTADPSSSQGANDQPPPEPDLAAARAAEQQQHEAPQFPVTEQQREAAVGVAAPEEAAVGATASEEAFVQASVPGLAAAASQVQQLAALAATPLPAAAAVPALSAGPAASGGATFTITPATMQSHSTGVGGGFSDSATMAADMLHSVLVRAAKAKGEDTSTYVQRAIKSPAIMQEALEQATQAAAEEQMAQQMAELERYAATTEQLFPSCSAAAVPAAHAEPADAAVPAPEEEPGENAELPAAEGGGLQLRMHGLAPECRMPVPQGAVGVASGVVVTGGDGQPCVRVPQVAVLQPFLKEIEVSAVRTLVVDVYVGHPTPPLDPPDPAADPAAPQPGTATWRWYGIQLPVLLRAADSHADALNACDPGALPADAALGQLTAEIPCSLHYHAIMPALGQNVALFGVHLDQTPVILMGIAPVAPPAPPPPPPPPPAPALPPPGAARPPATPLARGGAAAGWPGGAAHAARAHEPAYDSEDEGACALERAISKLVRTKRNKYVQKKSASAWRIEPHLPREIAGAASDAIGRTRLSGYGWIKTAITGGIFRELLVCSSGERWWSCIPADMLAQLQADVVLARSMHKDGRLTSDAADVDAVRAAAAFHFPECVEHFAVYFEKIETRWLDTLLQRGWQPGEHAEPHARAVINGVLATHRATPGPPPPPPRAASDMGGPAAAAAAASPEAVPPPPPSAGEVDSADTVPLAAVAAAAAAADDAMSLLTPNADVPPPPGGPRETVGKAAKRRGKSGQTRRGSAKAAVAAAVSGLPPDVPDTSPPGVPSALPTTTTLDAGTTPQPHEGAGRGHDAPPGHAARAANLHPGTAAAAEAAAVAENGMHAEMAVPAAADHGRAAEHGHAGHQEQVHMHAVDACVHAWRHAKQEVLHSVLGLHSVDSGEVERGWKEVLGQGEAGGAHGVGDVAEGAAGDTQQDGAPSRGAAADEGGDAHMSRDAELGHGGGHYGGEHAAASEPSHAQRAAAEALAAHHSHVAMAAAAAAAEHAAAAAARDATAAAVDDARRLLAEAEAAAAAAEASLGRAAQRSGAAAELVAQLASDARTLSASVPRSALRAVLSEAAADSFDALLTAPTHTTAEDAAVASFYQPALYNPILYTAEQLGVTAADHRAYLQLFVPFGLADETAAAAAAGDAAAIDRANAIFAAWLDAQVGQQAAASAAAAAAAPETAAVGDGTVGGEADVTGLNRNIYLDSHGLPFVVNDDGSHSYLDPRRDAAAAAALGYVMAHGDDDDTDDEVDHAELQEIWGEAPAHISGVDVHASGNSPPPGQDAAAAASGHRGAAAAAGRQETRDGRRVSSRSRVVSKRLQESVLGDEADEEVQHGFGGGEGYDEAAGRSVRKRRRAQRLLD